MNQIRFRTTINPDFERLQLLLNQDIHPHIHLIDMPYRLTATWQDLGCEIGLWEKEGELLAWAVFQPPWWNLDYALHASLRGSGLESEIFAWGQDQMKSYAQRTGDEFYGSVEFFADTPDAQKTIVHLEKLGFQKFDWSIFRYTLDLAAQDLRLPQPPDGFHVRPLKGASEVNTYVELHRAVFNSDKMTVPWRKRMLNHPAYNPKLDLVIVNSADEPVGFCICWMWGTDGQIEPIGIHPAYQGKGLGRALELTALQTLRHYGVRTMHVDHTSFNEAAIALSQQTGFKQQNNALRYYIEV
ncbi:MAG: GNAT family N-acetyltransferase [Chloroflexi bacterium]|nr:GNAT family N-acetyltransferase [Chloroflexota bacterium]